MFRIQDLYMTDFKEKTANKINQEREWIVLMVHEYEGKHCPLRKSNMH